MPNFEKSCRCPGCGQCDAAMSAPDIQKKIELQAKTIRSLSAQLGQLKAEQEDIVKRADIRIGWHADIRRQVEGVLDRVNTLVNEMSGADLGKLGSLIDQIKKTIQSIKPPNRDLP